MPNMVKLAQLEVVERSEKLNFGIIKKDAEEEDDTFFRLQNVQSQTVIKSKLF